MKNTILAVVVVAAVTACATVDTSKLPRMGVDFAFDQKHKCQGVSPAIRLSNVPGGVASYEVKMTDLDVPSFHHWSQTLAATGPVIREGAGVSYFGPCPPSGTHRYEITVLARDSQKQAVAYGEKTVVAGK
jgi:phosphatidylethanolamine-binding protein (PEBP) family uncharacterized protein